MSSIVLLAVPFAIFGFQPLVIAASDPPAISNSSPQTARHSQSATTGLTPESGSLRYRNTASGIRFLGSQACAACHRDIFNQYLKTPHAQAASISSRRPELRDLPANGTTVCDQANSLCFRVFRDGNKYYISEFQVGADGREVFRETEELDYALGTPMAGVGYVIRRGKYLFESPLSYYSGKQDQHPQGWGLSPGYQSDTLGFDRPLVGACLVCHVGRLESTSDTSNLYKEPAFAELAIGCESCHGPGELHVHEREKHIPLAGKVDTSIVNPARLSSRLSNDTCNSCHELGEARIPLQGKSFVDFRPGTPLLDTSAVFKSQLIMGWNMEEWFDEMTVSKCYRATGGRLGCVSCHNPHLSVSQQDAPAYYRSRCMTCHTEKSCTLAIEKRRSTTPADNCIGCHMPKHVAPSFVMLGANGTSHEIRAFESEPMPTEGIPQPDPKTGLILINSKQGPEESTVPPIVLLQAYQSVLARHADRADLQERYNILLDELAESNPSNVLVLSALARREFQKQSSQGYSAAASYLNKAVDLGSQAPMDYVALAGILFRSGEKNRAAEVLAKATTLFPYIPTPYENLAFCYYSLGEELKERQVIANGLAVFPGDTNLRALQQKLPPAH